MVAIPTASKNFLYCLFLIFSSSFSFFSLSCSKSTKKTHNSSFTDRTLSFVHIQLYTKWQRPFSNIILIHSFIPDISIAPRHCTIIYQVAKTLFKHHSRSFIHLFIRDISIAPRHCTIIHQVAKTLFKHHSHSFIHLFIPDISIAPPQVHYYSEALQTTELILCQS